MNNEKTPLTLRKGVTLATGMVFGAIMGGLLTSIGETTGEYQGMMETNDWWLGAIDRVKEDLKNDKDEPEE